MTMLVLIVVCLLSIILSIIALVFALYSHSKMVGLENSTHQLTYVPLEEELKGKTPKNEPKPEDLVYNDLDDEHL